MAEHEASSLAEKRAAMMRFYSVIRLVKRIKEYLAQMIFRHLAEKMVVTTKMYLAACSSEKGMKKYSVC